MTTNSMNAAVDRLAIRQFGETGRKKVLNIINTSRVKVGKCLANRHESCLAVNLNGVLVESGS